MEPKHEPSNSDLIPPHILNTVVDLTDDQPARTWGMQTPNKDGPRVLDMLDLTETRENEDEDEDENPLKGLCMRSVPFKSQKRKLDDMPEGGGTPKGSRRGSRSAIGGDTPKYSPKKRSKATVESESRSDRPPKLNLTKDREGPAKVTKATAPTLKASASKSAFPTAKTSSKTQTPTAGPATGLSRLYPPIPISSTAPEGSSSRRDSTFRMPVRPNFSRPESSATPSNKPTRSKDSLSDAPRPLITKPISRKSDAQRISRPESRKADGYVSVEQFVSPEPEKPVDGTERAFQVQVSKPTASSARPLQTQLTKTIAKPSSNTTKDTPRKIVRPKPYLSPSDSMEDSGSENAVTKKVSSSKRSSVQPPPPPLDGPDQQLIREYEDRLKRLKSYLKTVKDERDALKTERDHLDALSDERQKQIFDTQREVNIAKNALVLSAVQINDLTSICKLLEKKNENLTELHATKDRTIEDLGKEVRELKTVKLVQRNLQVVRSPVPQPKEHEISLGSFPELERLLKASILNLGEDRGRDAFLRNIMDRYERGAFTRNADAEILPAREPSPKIADRHGSPSCESSLTEISFTTDSDMIEHDTTPASEVSSILSPKREATRSPTPESDIAKMTFDIKDPFIKGTAPYSYSPDLEGGQPGTPMALRNLLPSSFINLKEKGKVALVQTPPPSRAGWRKKSSLFDVSRLMKLNLHSQVDMNAMRTQWQLQAILNTPITIETGGTRRIKAAKQELADKALERKQNQDKLAKALNVPEPSKLVPLFKDGALAFREGRINARTKRIDRNAPIYKVGRYIPGELR